MRGILPGKKVKRPPPVNQCDMAEKCGVREPPLCPMQEDSLKNGIWYADEAICAAEKYQRLGWIKKQKEISRLKLKNDAGYFTLEMLKVLRVVKPELRGADPDDPGAEKKWLNKHAPHRKNKPAPMPKLKTIRPETRKRQTIPLQGSFTGF